MAGFIIKTGIQIAKGAGAVGKGTGKAVVYSAPKVTRPAREFARALVTGSPKYAKLAEGYGTTATIYASTRAGMQLNRAAKLVAYGAVQKAPYAVANLGKRAVRAAIRDEVITPYYSAAYQAYAAVRGGRALRGATSVIERYADAAFGKSARLLGKVGLGPGLVADGFSVGRIIIFGGAYEAIRSAAGRLEQLERYAAAMANEYKDLKDRAIARLPELAPVPVPQPTGIVQPAPVAPIPAPPVIVPAAPPPAPPRNTEYGTAPVPMRRRR